MLYHRRGIIRFSLFLAAALLISLLSVSPLLAVDLSISITVPGSSTPPLGGGGGGGTVLPSANVAISGIAYPFAILTFLRDGAVIGTGVASPDGTFESLFLVDTGPASFGVWARDEYSLISPTVSVAFDLSGGSLARIEGVALPPTIAHEHIGSDGSLTIYGSAYPGSAVRIFNNIVSFAIPFSTIADDDGQWSYTIPRGGFNAGNFSYKANYQDEATGILSPFSENLELRLVTCSNSDFNGDGAVNLTDLSILMFYWGRRIPTTGLSNGCVDRNQDQIVDLVDFSILMYEWTIRYQQN